MSAAPPAAAPATPAATTIVTPPAAPAVTPPVDLVRDQQTGKVYKKRHERWYDIASAWISALYSIGVIVYLTFMVLYLLSGKYAFWPEGITNKIANLLTNPVSKLLLYTAIGGAMGAAVNNLRSFIAWHAEDKAFGWRFIWKYVAMPPLGGTLAVLVYGILQGGMAVINGGATPENNQLTSLSAWATGTLAGYGSSKVFIWLDDKVNTLFKIEKKQVPVPDVTGKSRDEARQLLSNAQLEVGTVSEEVAGSSDQVDKVISQTPGAGTQIDCGSKVDLTVGIASPADNPNPTVAPELMPSTHNGNGTSSNGNTVVVGETATDVTEAAESNETTASETATGETATDETATDETATTETSETTASETEEQPT